MSKRLAVMSMFTAFAIALSYIESFIPVIGIPGAKLGFANIAVILVIYQLGFKEAMSIHVVKIIVVGAMFGSMISIIFSIAGALFSILVMVGLKKTNLFSIVGVSIAGGVSHNIGQLFVAAIVIETYRVSYYVPVLIILGVITGLAIGIVANVINERTKVIVKNMISNNNQI